MQFDCFARTAMSETPSVPFLFSKRPRSRPSALRKRPLESESALAPETNDEPSTSEVVSTSKKAVMNHLVQGTGASLAKRRRAEQELSEVLSEEEEVLPSFEVRHGNTKRERRRSSSPPAEISAESIKAAAQAKLVNTPLDPAKDDGLYRGSAGAAHKLPKAFGPVKGGPGNVRTITMVDYQPDVCKDYKGQSSVLRPPPFSADTVYRDRILWIRRYL